jgi:hypothetical protein
MPTKRPRYTITADDDLESTLARRRPAFPPGTPDSKIIAALIRKGEEAIAQEERAAADDEARRRAAAKRLAERFERPDGFDYAALREASALWSRE